MADEFVFVEGSGGESGVSGDGVAVLRLDRPPMNALSNPLLEELAGRLSDLARDPAVRAVVVRGSEKVFCAGADVKDMHTALAEGRNPGALVSTTARKALDALAAFARPTIAAVTGVALGGGLELALACDFRVASEKARLGQPEILLGIFPGAGATQRLPRLVGPARAKWMIYSGDPVLAPRALEWGLVDVVVPPEEVFARALADAARFAAGASAAIGLAKRAIDGGLDGLLADGLSLETRLFEEVYTTDDAKSGIRSFVEEGPGKAVFSGH